MPVSRSRLAATPSRLAEAWASAIDPTPGLVSGSAEARAVEADLVRLTVRNARMVVATFLVLILLASIEFVETPVTLAWHAFAHDLGFHTIVWRLGAVAALGLYLVADMRVRRLPRPRREAASVRLARASVWLLLTLTALYAPHMLWSSGLAVPVGLMSCIVAVLLHPSGRSTPAAFGVTALLGVGACSLLIAAGAPAPDPELQPWTLIPITYAFAFLLWRVIHGGLARGLAGRRSLRKAHRSLRLSQQHLAAAERAAGQAAERARISRDLHDHVGGRLSAMLAETEAARLEGRPEAALAAAEAGARETMEGLRETVWALHHEALTAGALTDRIARFAQPRTAVYGMTVAVHLVGDAECALSPDRALNLFRITQEAITNALKHSGARAITVTVEARPGHLAAEVADDGCFATPGGDGAANGLQGFGMRTLRARAEALGGTLTVTTDAGTVVRVDVPTNER